MFYLHVSGRTLFAFILLSELVTKHRDIACPYVSYEARQAAVASPQSAGLEASSALLQCYATRVWPRPVSIGCLEERSHCTRRRCRWGSVEIRKYSSQRVKLSRLHKFNHQNSFHESCTCSLASSIHSFRVFLIVG